VERDNLNQMMGIAGNFANFKEVGYMIDWRSMLQTNNVPLLSEDDYMKIKGEYEQKEQEAMQGPEQSQSPRDHGGVQESGNVNQLIEALNEHGRMPLILSETEIKRLTNRKPYDIR
jgi:hypothetical protein